MNNLIKGCIISLGGVLHRKTSIGSKPGDTAANKITDLYKIRLIFTSSSELVYLSCVYAGWMRKYLVDCRDDLTLLGNTSKQARGCV